MDFQNGIEKSAEILQSLIDNSNKTVLFCGAGISTESGIPDFRSKDGLYNMKYDVPPETILSHTYFLEHTSEFYRFYRDKMLVSGVYPNAAHNKLAELEAKGKLSSVITQNIDTLHHDAGSKNVLELHGTISSYHCFECNRHYDLTFVVNCDGVPRCTCGGVIKPDVVLYEEQLDNNVCDKAINEITTADLLIVVGTSLTVYPAAGFITYYNGNKLVLINKDETPYDRYADYIFRHNAGELFKRIKA